MYLVSAMYASRLEFLFVCLFAQQMQKHLNHLKTGKKRGAECIENHG